jgi:GMP synthase (glutamine-hydrolysing)
MLVVQHEDDAPPGWFGEWFESAGLELDIRLGHRAHDIPVRITDHDALVVLGGEMGAYDDAEHAWLGATKALIARTVDDGRPFLGICLGHQLATVALGGAVTVNPAGPAIGLRPVTRTDDGRADELLTTVADGARTIQWNNDVVSRLPSGAVRLATAPDATVQAARFAPHAWGIQFHPEASPEIFGRWVKVAAPDQREDLEAILRAIDDAHDELRANWEPLARRFAGVVVAQPAVR